MKKMLVLLAVCALMAGTASAQTTTPAPSPRAMRPGPAANRLAAMTPEQHADAQAQRLTKQLGLSAEQTTQVRAIALAQAQEAQTLRGQAPTSGNRPARGQELKNLRDKYDAQLKAVLTSDQYATYTQQRDDRRQKHQQFKSSRIKAKG